METLILDIEGVLTVIVGSIGAFVALQETQPVNLVRYCFGLLMAVTVVFGLANAIHVNLDLPLYAIRIAIMTLGIYALWVTRPNRR